MVNRSILDSTYQVKLILINYKNIKRRNQLECEIDKLEKSNEHLKKYLNVYDPVANMEKRIHLNNKLIADKYIEIDQNGYAHS